MVGWLVRYSFKLRGWKHPALAKWSLPVIHPFVQSNSESKDPCTLLIEDRQTLKPLEKICRGLGPTGAHPPSTALPLAPTHIECGSNIPKQVQVAYRVLVVFGLILVVVILKILRCGNTSEGQVKKAVGLFLMRWSVGQGRL